MAYSEFQLQTELNDTRVGQRSANGSERGCIEHAAGIAESSVIPGIEGFRKKAEPQIFVQRSHFRKPRIPQIRPRTANRVAPERSIAGAWRWRERGRIKKGVQSRAHITLSGLRNAVHKIGAAACSRRSGLTIAVQITCRISDRKGSARLHRDNTRQLPAREQCAGHAA